MQCISRNFWRWTFFIAGTAGFSCSLVLALAAEDAPGSLRSANPKERASFEESTLAGSPQIEFVTTTYNFDKVIGGKPVRHDFLYTNTGSQTLEIKNVITSCGCTTAGEWNRTVEPGKTGTIPVELRTGGFNREIRKSIRVTTNVPGKEQITLWMEGTVWQPIEIKPRYAGLGSINNMEEPKKKIVKLINHFQEPLQIEDMKSSDPTFHTSLKTIKPGKEFELEITATPPFKPGSHVGTITLKTSSEKKPEISITTSYYVPARVQFTPSKLLLPAGSLDKAMERSVFVIHNAPTPLKISDVKVNAKNVATRIVEMREGKQFRIILSFPEKFTIPDEGKTTLTFTTDDPSAPVIHVPISHVRHQPAKPVPRVSKPIRSATL